MQKAKKWNQDGNTYSLSDNTKQIATLPVAIYVLNKSLFGFYLEKIEDKFEFGHKLYGLERDLIDRVIRTWNSTNKNLGVLLNGLKGTGKTVTSKVICNELNLPVILVNENPEGGGIPEFLNDVQQDVIVMMDEYEKVFGDGSELLTLMDGVLTSDARKLFLLTTNNTYINDNMLQRPSRIRYHKTFKDLSLEIITEIVEDILVHKQHRTEVISAISGLEVITIDVVKSIVEEVNIHNEAPSAFMSVFNVKKISGRHSVIKLTENKGGKPIEEVLHKGVKVYPREFDEESVGRYFEVDENTLGEIKEVLDFDTARIKPRGEKNAKDIVIRVEAHDSVHRNFKFKSF
jgi:DNA polymerase III gamma/tau subunit